MNILLYIKDIFYNTNLLRDNESFNREAGNLFNKNYQNFEERVFEFSEESRKKENLIEEENHYEMSMYNFIYTYSYFLLLFFNSYHLMNDKYLYFFI